MGNRFAEWPLGGAFGISVNPLVISGGLGKGVDALLVDDHPVAGAHDLSDEALQFGQGFVAFHCCALDSLFDHGSGAQLRL
ncbi:hypothetical protein D3C75_1236000 [compost metagenome]